jgi:hypothetical protein
MCCDVEQLGVFWRGSCFRKARALDSVVGYVVSQAPSVPRNTCISEVQRSDKYLRPISSHLHA